MSRPIVCLIALLLSGCATLTSPARRHQLEKGETYWFDYDAGRRGAVLVPYNGRRSGVRFCAEPSPDIALKSTVDLIAKAQTPQGVSAEGSAKISTDAIALAGRTQTVVFLREALYRLCEQSLNGNLTQDQVAPLFGQILETSHKIAQAQLASEISKTPADKLPSVDNALQAAPVSLPPPGGVVQPAPELPAQQP